MVVESVQQLNKKTGAMEWKEVKYKLPYKCYPDGSFVIGALSDYTRYMFSLPFIGFAGMEFTRLLFVRKFYVDDYPQLNLSMMAFASVGSVFLDAYLNPIVANVSDNMRSKFGRRRPFILFSARTY